MADVAREAFKAAQCLNFSAERSMKGPHPTCKFQFNFSKKNLHLSIWVLNRYLIGAEQIPVTLILTITKCLNRYDEPRKDA